MDYADFPVRYGHRWINRNDPVGYVGLINLEGMRNSAMLQKTNVCGEFVWQSSRRS